MPVITGPQLQLPCHLLENPRITAQPALMLYLLDPTLIVSRKQPCSSLTPLWRRQSYTHTAEPSGHLPSPASHPALT